MANNINIGQLAEQIAKELSQYTDDIADAVKKDVDDVTTELLNNIRADAPKKTGKYKRAMATKTAYESRYEKRNKWYVKKPYYRLTHLLEKGHAKRGGGRVQAYPHIEKNEKKAIKALEEKVKKTIKGGRK